MRLLLTALLATLVLGCSSVTTLHPVGKPIEDEHGKTVDGTWQFEDQVYHAKYIGEGKIRFAQVEWNGERFELSEHTALLMLHQDAGYLHVMHEDDDTPPRYAFFRCIGDEDSILLLQPNYEAFRKAVDSGQLTGEVEKDDNQKEVHLTATKEQFDAFIDKAKAGEQFDLDTVMSLRRIGKKDD
jgi:hypothetical protein